MITKLKRIYRKITQKSRLEEYRRILIAAIEHCYRVMTLREWVELGFPRDKIFLLRHDVDIDARGARRMYEIEKELHVRATYYFRHITMKPTLMKHMLSDGFEVGLHYETLATFIRESRLETKEQLSEDIFTTCRVRLTREIACFREEIGEMQSICSHGSKWNRKLDISNCLLADEKFRKENGILFETYDPELLDNISTYISDSSLSHNHAWRYGKSPLQAIENGDAVILLLTHPGHWNYDFCSNIRKLWLSFIDPN